MCEATLKRRFTPYKLDACACQQRVGKEADGEPETVLSNAAVFSRLRLCCRMIAALLSVVLTPCGGGGATPLNLKPQNSTVLAELTGHGPSHSAGQWQPRPGASRRGRRIGQRPLQVIKSMIPIVGLQSFFSVASITTRIVICVIINNYHYCRY